jgi:hypothetical protein
MSASNPILNNEQGPFERAPELATRVAQPGGVMEAGIGSGRQERDTGESQFPRPAHE